jgi:hypothetical protein
MRATLHAHSSPGCASHTSEMCKPSVDTLPLAGAADINTWLRAMADVLCVSLKELDSPRSALLSAPALAAQRRFRGSQGTISKQKGAWLA